jgi:hypothetical protein
LDIRIKNLKTLIETASCGLGRGLLCESTQRLSVGTSGGVWLNRQVLASLTELTLLVAKEDSIIGIDADSHSRKVNEKTEIDLEYGRDRFLCTMRWNICQIFSPLSPIAGSYVRIGPQPFQIRSKLERLRLKRQR